MPSVYPSLLHYLSTKNPTLDVIQRKGGSNTKSGKFGWDLPRQIQAWADFDYQSLDSIYNGALRNVLHRQSNFHQQVLPDESSCEIHSEDDMTHIVVLWNKSIVSTGLKAAQKRLGTDLPHEKICMSQGKQAQPPVQVTRLINPESNGKKQYQTFRSPDWAGRKRSTVNPNEPRTQAKKSNKAKNLLPGDTKVSSKWTSTSLASLPVGDVAKADLRDRNWFQPVGQIYTYCVRLNARYGYIITDEELVVFRIRPLAQSGAPQKQKSPYRRLKEFRKLDPNITASPWELEDIVEGAPEATRALTDGLMEYKVVPWSSHMPTSHRNSKVMTVNLALWWLHMMAAENSAIEEDYVALAHAVWDTDPGNKTPAYAVVESDSQGTAPLRETSFNSQSCVKGFESDLGGRKRTRDDDGDAEMLHMAGPSKRPTRGRKRGPG